MSPRRSGIDPAPHSPGRGRPRPGPPAPPPARSASLVLPYLGGGFVRGPARRYRVLGRLQAGWYRFRVDGAEAVAIEEKV